MRLPSLRTAFFTIATTGLALGSWICTGCTSEPGGGAARPVVRASAAAKVAAQHANALGFRLLQQLVANKERSNVALSGLSAAMALALFHEACHGDSRRVLAAALGYPGAAEGTGTEGAVAEGYGDLLAVLQGRTAATIRFANAVYVREDVVVLPDFLAVAQQRFGAVVRSRPFAEPKTLAELNGWVAQQTDGMIPAILDQMDPANFTILLNALYFQGQWQQQFDPARTKPRDFHPEEGASFQVPMMQDRVMAVVHHDETLGAVRMPYRGGDYSMVVVMPLAKRKLAALRGELAGERWRELWSALSREAVETSVGLPKFRVAATHALNQPLQALGLGPALEAGKADYSRLAAGMDATVPVEAMVTQRVVVEVEETGSKAAAVTMVEMKLTSAPMPPVFEPYFDRPFLFAIVEQQTGVILFLGQVVDPRS
jgi:serpin B